MTTLRWAGNLMGLNGPPEQALLQSFREVVDQAADERPVQQFLASHPQFLRPMLPPGRRAWYFDRPRFGSERVPDFLLCTENSNGKHWVMVEIESPTRRVLTQKGLPSAKLVEAQTQIRDWRAWLRSNIAYARSELGFEDLDAECRAYVIIGRRDSIDPKLVTRYRELSTAKTTIMTYDRLLDALSG